MKRLAEQVIFTEVAPQSLRSLSDDEIGELRREFSESWDRMRAGEPLPEGLNREEFLNRFIFLIREMEKRRLPTMLTNGIGRAARRLIEASDSPHPLDGLREQDGPRSMKEPDAQFIVERLKAGREALSLSGTNRSGLTDIEWILVNERLTPDTPIMAWARVKFSQLEDTIQNLQALGSRLAGVGEVKQKDFEDRDGPFYVLKFELLDAFDPPIELKEPPPGRRFGGELDLEAARLKEAFHLRDVHWVPVPESGRCPTTHPTRLKFPGTETLRCFTASAARVVRARMTEAVDRLDFDNFFVIDDGMAQDLGDDAPAGLEPIGARTPEAWALVVEDRASDRNMAGILGGVRTQERAEQAAIGEAEHRKNPNLIFIIGAEVGKIDGRKVFKDVAGFRYKSESMHEQVEKLTNERAKLRDALTDNPTERCGFCTYFRGPSTCQIVDGPVARDRVCDWIFSRETEAGMYKISDEDWLVFVKGMVEKQPYQHKVIDGAITPTGSVVLIEDSADPPHRFSLTKAFHVEHTSLEHHWTQDEVDALVEVGKKDSMTEAVLQEGPVLGAYIRGLREKMGLTLAAFGRQFKMAPSTVGSVERGTVKRPPDNCLEMIAKGLGIPAARLISMRDRESGED